MFGSFQSPSVRTASSTANTSRSASATGLSCDVTSTSPRTTSPGFAVVLARCGATFNSRSGDRKSTRLNSSHVEISYAVFCLKKKKNMIEASFRQRPKREKKEENLLYSK